MTSPQVVLVAGARRSGVTSVAAALRERMPEHAVVEGDALAGERPAVVVVVASAVAPVAESDCTGIDVVTAEVDAVVGVIAKIDAHRGWRDVLAANRATFAARSSRYRAIPWLGVAAAPDVGDPNVDTLVAALREPLDESSGRLTRVGRLRGCRAALVRERRSTRTERAMTLRAGLHRERLRLGRFVRQRCAGLRAEFRAAAAEVPRGRARDFEQALAAEASEVLAELDEQIATGLGELAAALGVAAPATPGLIVAPELPGLPITTPGVESRLTVALGAGFGLGVAMAVSRVMTGLAPGLTVAALAVGGLAGCALTAWLVMARALLQHRAALDRWVTEAVAALRWQAEDVIAGGLLAAEAGLATELGARDEALSVAAAERIRGIDDEIRRLTRHEETGR
ncbi:MULTISPECIES: hypothetical protein [unclassified Mycobacterium]|uniref:hypothetical protein n=1 Tax=unclassified Mycobacterium TaxID=2642494 RepID=UPI0029C84A19|nr:MULTISPECIES: hypothetical protein [unclassified Mycobacterium]